MQYKLYNERPNIINPLHQIIKNRGVPVNKISQYINTTDDDINDPYLLDNIKTAATTLHEAVEKKQKMLVVVDCDCDGYTSAALFINFFYKIYPEYKIDFVMHEGKQHGLNDLSKSLIQQYDILMIPDASSNDYEAHMWCKIQGIKVVIADHHMAERVSANAVVVNNQLSEKYPNKELSGVGVTWQLCRVYAQLFCPIFEQLPYYFLDLVATGLMGDMMSLLNFETKHLIRKGFQDENIHNPFISKILEKNNFSLNKPKYKSSIGLACSPIGASFFIVPFINAMARSGTIEEKNLLFKSMLHKFAFDMIPSNKRGHKAGETEQLVEQAIRTCTNVKARQTKAEQAGMELLEDIIHKDNMLQTPTLVFLLEPGQIDRSIAGLVANKIAAKYQRCCLVLTRTSIINPATNQLENHYIGSGRGFSRIGETRFKLQCADTAEVDYAEGHLGAFGVSINENNLEAFKNKLNASFEAEASSDLTYLVDYVFTEEDIGIEHIIIDISNMNDYWGKDFNRSLVAVQMTCKPDKVTIMAKQTMKIRMDNGINIIKFECTPEEQEIFKNKEVDILIIAECNANEWNDKISGQLILIDYEITNIKNNNRYFF